jgi:hypothetical protein
MTMRFKLPPDPAAQGAQARGAAPVGYLEELPPLEASAIRAMRAWCEGGAALTLIELDDVARLGRDTALDTLEALDRLSTKP